MRSPLSAAPRLDAAEGSYNIMLWGRRRRSRAFGPITGLNHSARQPPKITCSGVTATSICSGSAGWVGTLGQHALLLQLDVALATDGATGNGRRPRSPCRGALVDRWKWVIVVDSVRVRR